jgi:hypothetical protein
MKPNKQEAPLAARAFPNADPVVVIHGWTESGVAKHQLYVGADDRAGNLNERVSVYIRDETSTAEAVSILRAIADNLEGRKGAATIEAILAQETFERDGRLAQ